MPIQSLSWLPPLKLTGMAVLATKLVAYPLCTDTVIDIGCGATVTRTRGLSST